MADPTETQPAVHFGTTVYSDDGERRGTARGFDDHGFYVTVEEGIESLSVEHLRSSHEFGEVELMWRCLNCGEMGEIDDEIPGTCPSCGVGKEEIYYWTED